MSNPLTPLLQLCCPKGALQCLYVLSPIYHTRPSIPEKMIPDPRRGVMRSGVEVGTHATPSGLDHVGQAGALAYTPRRAERAPGKAEASGTTFLKASWIHKMDLQSPGTSPGVGKLQPTGLAPISVNKFLLVHTPIPICGLLSATIK